MEKDLPVGKERRHVKHNLIILEDGEYSFGSCVIVFSVQSSRVARVALKADCVTKNSEELLKFRTGVVVLKYVLLCKLVRFLI